MPDDLNTALGYHQRGLLAEAARIYEGLLAGNPEHVEALNYLGVVALQQGNPQRAVELMGRALVLNPGAAAVYANLGEAYRTAGDFRQAVGCCRAALRLQPNFPEAANGLGLALQVLGQSEAAMAQFRAAVEMNPGFAAAHNNLADALRIRGDSAQALTHFRRAVEIAPQWAEARSNLGQFLLEQLKLEEALVHCREAVRLRPDLPQTQNNLGNVLRELGRLAEAQACYAEALRLGPGLAMTYSNMGQSLQEEGRLGEAVAWYRRALELEPNLVRAHWNLGGALEEQEDHAAATASYQAALRLDPRCAEAHNGLGWVLHEQGHFQEALGYYRKAIELKPDLAAAHCSLGTLLEELSDFDGAQRCFRESLRHDPRSAQGYALLATLLGGKLPPADLADQQRLLHDPNLSNGKRSALHFGLAHVLDAQGAYAAAAEHLQQANALGLAERRQRGQGYDPEGHAQFVAGMIATCTRAFFERTRGFGLDSERPIFIVGLPRSGTTLIEQILASHSQVFGAGELPLGRDDFESLGAGDDSAVTAMEGLGRLDRQTARRLAQRHLERLGELNQAAGRVADKMPDNYLYMGLLATLFPRAKFIHCRRDLRDIAVSCWMTNFRHIRWANDQEHIALRFQEYQRLTQYWRDVLPVPVLETAYEETVADLETVARRVVDWCGLEWEPACLEFYRGKWPVRTASVTQVRQPIYTKSVARWKHYEQALAPCFAKLPTDKSVRVE
jgi:tetratricopeptide (TPR) repeat protein